MARPKKPDDQRRGVQRLVRLTPSEDAALMERATQANMDHSDFIRRMALKRKFTPRRPLAEKEFMLYVRGELGHAGSNLNQLVRRLNAADMTPSARAVQEVLAQLTAINTEILRLLRDDH